MDTQGSPWAKPITDLTKAAPISLEQQLGSGADVVAGFRTPGLDCGSPSVPGAAQPPSQGPAEEPCGRRPSASA